MFARVSQRFQLQNKRAQPFSQIKQEVCFARRTPFRTSSQAIQKYAMKIVCNLNIYYTMSKKNFFTVFRRSRKWFNTHWRRICCNTRHLFQTITTKTSISCTMFSRNTCSSFEPSLHLEHWPKACFINW